MERIRAQLAEEALRHRAPDSPNSVISISSNSSGASSVVPLVKNKVRPTVILDSDEEEDSDTEEEGSNAKVDDSDAEVDELRDLSLQEAPKFPVPHPAPAPPLKEPAAPSFPVAQLYDHGPNSKQPRPVDPLRHTTNAPFVPKPIKPSVPALIAIPNNHRLPPSVEVVHETFDVLAPEPYEYEVKKTAAEADRDLKELFEGGIDDGLDEINMEEAIVEGFKDGIVLKPHQVKGRVWMRDRETGKKAGGLLCDDMGLGKTIQTVVRIVDGPPSKEDRKNGWARTSLVICPVALVKQWAQEIKKYTGGTLRVVEHHGPSRTSDPDMLAHAHVVVTSYAVVASEYAVWRGDAKDESATNAKKKKAASAPDSDFGNSDSSSNFGKTLMKARAKKAPAKKAKKVDALFRVQWWRIVLDEAHNIKNRKTKQAVACCELTAKYRWALTGTPIQNNVEDLYSLLKFLRIRPLNDWSHFNETIAKPVKAGRSGRAMKRLHVVMKAIMLRRLKDAVFDGAPLINLPPRTVEVVECDFDDDERAFYTALEEKTTLTMNKFIKRGEVMSNYTQVMVLLLRLRQACNHPILVSKDFQQDAAALDPKLMNKGKLPDDDNEDDGLADLFRKMDVNTAKRCDVCQTELDKNSTSSSSRKRCDDCELQLAVEARRKSGRVGSDLPPSSAKLRKILELLETIDENSDGTEKTIIFSQFTTMLDLIQPFLRDAGIKYVRYDGSMNPKQREASLEAIRENRSTRVILISFKAGGAGLNLTSCNNVILVDLWWNPALEEQAFGRVHRYGQEREVMIYKLTIEKTVEQRILTLQDTKRALANAALSGDKLKNSKLGEDDIMALFRPGARDSDDED